MAHVSEQVAKELEAVTKKVKVRQDETGEQYTERVLEEISGLPDEEYKKFSKETVDWFNASVDAIEAKRKANGGEHDGPELVTIDPGEKTTSDEEASEKPAKTKKAKAAPKAAKAKAAPKAAGKAKAAPKAEAAPKVKAAPKKAAKKAPAKKAAAKTKKASAKTAALAREGSKRARVLASLGTKKGATSADICQLTGWTQHTVHGFLTALRKEGELTAKRNEDGTCVYHFA